MGIDLEEEEGEEGKSKLRGLYFGFAPMLSYYSQYFHRRPYFLHSVSPCYLAPRLSTPLAQVLAIDFPSGISIASSSTSLYQALPMPIAPLARAQTTGTISGKQQIR